MLELGVKVLVQHNAMVMLDARRITHFSSKPNVSVAEYRMYGTALVQSKRTLDAAEDISQNILQDLHQGWVDSRRAEVLKVAAEQNKRDTCDEPETEEGADELNHDPDQDEDQYQGEDQDMDEDQDHHQHQDLAEYQDKDKDQDQDQDLHQDQDQDREQDHDRDLDVDHDSQMAEEHGLAACTTPQKAAKVKFIIIVILSPKCIT
jgi:hypothetical protein